MSREMLDRWNNKLPERKAIMEFWDWLVEEINSEGDDDDHTEFNDIDPEEYLDQYHGIDRAQLEKERRELLEETQRLQDVKLPDCFDHGTGYDRLADGAVQQPDRKETR
jgi:hypothetical protein